MAHDNLDAWLEEYGQMPLIQVLMAPAVVKLVATLLTQAGAGIELQPVVLGKAEPPTLMAVPGGALIRRLLAVDFGAAMDHQESGPPDAETLERMTGFFRHPVSELPPPSELPPDDWRD